MAYWMESHFQYGIDCNRVVFSTEFPTELLVGLQNVGILGRKMLASEI